MVVCVLCAVSHWLLQVIISILFVGSCLQIIIRGRIHMDVLTDDQTILPLMMSMCFASYIALMTAMHALHEGTGHGKRKWVQRLTPLI